MVLINSINNRYPACRPFIKIVGRADTFGTQIVCETHKTTGSWVGVDTWERQTITKMEMFASVGVILATGRSDA